MTTGTKALLVAVFGGLSLSVGASHATAGIVNVLQQSATVDRHDNTASFRLTFDAPPDFYTIDEFDRPENSFQYEVFADWSGKSSDPKFGSRTTIVRGDEIHVANDLRIRSADFDHPDPDPDAHGWGPVLGSVPFELSGNTLTFTTPLSLIGDQDGIFAYRVFPTNFGAGPSSIEGHVVPLPAGALTGGIGVAGLAVVEMVRRRRHRAQPA